MFPVSTLIDVSPEHLSNALSPMLVTEFGILKDVSPEQPMNALSPMLFTEFGMLTDVSPEQFQYLQPIITQYFIDNKSEIWLLFLIAHSKR